MHFLAQVTRKTLLWEAVSLGGAPVPPLEFVEKEAVLGAGLFVVEVLVIFVIVRVQVFKAQRQLLDGPEVIDDDGRLGTW